MKFVLGDLTKVRSGIVAHQVNLHGVMGAGVALYLAKANQGLALAYSEACKTAQMGDVFMWESPSIKDELHPDGNLVIANVFSQLRTMHCRDDEYKNEYVRKHGITSYDAIITAFDHIESQNTEKKSIYVPFGYGCGIAGGRWNIVEEIFSDYDDIVIVCRENDVLRDLGDVPVTRKWLKKMEVLNV